VGLPVQLPGHFATRDAPCGSGKRKMPSSFPGSFSRAENSGQLLKGSFDRKIPVLT
jgi:hypothetical protein